MRFGIEDIDLESIDAVIFDLDGTMYNKASLARRIVSGELGRLGVLSREQAARKSLRGKYFGTGEAFYDAFFLEMADGNRFFAKFARFWYFYDYMPLMVRTLRYMYRTEDWVLEFVRDLRRAGKKVAVYSDYGCVEKKMKALGMPLEMVDVIAAAPDLGGLKPAKEPLMKVINQLGVKPERCLMIGDRDDTDGASARALNMQFMMIDNNTESKRPQKENLR